jgi:hypothetical protein
MFGLLTSYLSPKVATVLCAVWFAALLVAILVLSVEPPADFRYARY